MSRTLRVFGHGDGSHWGVGDWYQDKEDALVRALQLKKPFDTGWYSSKKEIVSAKISSPDGKTIDVRVSVSDDFDTEGNAGGTCRATIPAIRKALSKFWYKAEKDRKYNQLYQGYSLIRHERGKQTCLDYYIVNRCGLAQPPGDNYHHWGWQSDPDDKSPQAGNKPDPEWKVPAETQVRLEEFMLQEKKGSLKIGKWEVKNWNDQ